MIDITPALLFFMGGEGVPDGPSPDVINMAFVVFGGTATDDGQWPGYTVPADQGGVPDDDYDSTLCVPQTLMFTAEGDKPKSTGDYPLRQCSISGNWGAPHAMVSIDGLWYLRTYAPDPRSAKRYRPRGGIG